MVRVSFVGEARGRGLLATRRIFKGEVFLIETPLVSVQDVSTSAQVLACGCCLRFVGSLGVQAAVASGARSRIHVLETELPTASLPNLPDNQTNMLSEIWPCQQGCGAVYCSSVCRDSDWARGHRLLCVGLVSEEEADTNALVKFKRDADWPVDSLALLAKAAAHVVCRYHENGGNLQAAMEPYTYFDSLLWWELGSGSANATKTQRKEWAERASYLLHQALADGSPDVSPMFNTESFGRILGMLEMNQLAIVLESPLVQYSHEVARLSSKHAGLQADALAVLGPLAWKLQCLQDDIAQSDSEDDSEDEDEGSDEGEPDSSHTQRLYSSTPTSGEVAGCSKVLFPSLDGVGLYTLVCMMNHSCSPNAQVNYTQGGRNPVQARVVALRDIEVGMEICHSYIHENAPVEERITELRRSYNFECNCERCGVEKST